MDRLAVGVRIAADVECVQVEAWPHRFEAKARNVGVGQLAAQQVHEQRGDQRAVDDQARVTLDLRHMLAVVARPRRLLHPLRR